MSAITDLQDQIPELNKRVMALQLLTEVDVSGLESEKFNSWLGLLFDSIDLLDQVRFDLNTFSKRLSDS